ncbi:MAG: hypothetical protein WD834_02005 [Actinomycetota bacterium]
MSGTRANASIAEHQRYPYPHDHRTAGYLCPICRIHDALPPITDPAGLLEQLWIDILDVVTWPTECRRCSENVDDVCGFHWCYPAGIPAP